MHSKWNNNSFCYEIHLSRVQFKDGSFLRNWLVSVKHIQLEELHSKSLQSFYIHSLNVAGLWIHSINLMLLPKFIASKTNVLKRQVISSLATKLNIVDVGTKVCTIRITAVTVAWESKRTLKESCLVKRKPTNQCPNQLHLVFVTRLDYLQ